MRAAVRILLTGVVLYLYWRFKESATGLLAFVAYVGALFVEQWAMARFREKRPVPPRPERVDRATQEASGDYVSLLVVVLALAVMGDAFFFTDWLDIPADGSVGMRLLKIVASLVALAVALLGPIVVGTMTYIELAEWISRRSDSSDFVVTFGPVVPVALVTVACYGHFYLGYLIYGAMGALRS